MITPDTPEEKILSEEQERINALIAENKAIQAEAERLRALEASLSGFNDTHVQKYLIKKTDKESSL